jgi:hypothetical protein
MGNRIWTVTLVSCAAFLLIHARVDAASKSGDIKLPEGFDKAVKVELGDTLKAECHFYINDFFGKKVISPQATIKNPSKKTMYFGYYVAFYDKDKNLLACTSFSGDLAKVEPGKETSVGNIVELPVALLGKVASYQVTLLEDEKEFGK